MAAGAFKTKYTGQQIEELFDKLNSDSGKAPQAGKGQYYTLEQPISSNSGSDFLTSHTYETQDMTVTIKGNAYGPTRGAHLCSIFNTNTNHYMWYYGGATLTYKFKSPINPWRIRYNGTKMNIEIYDGNEWTTKTTNTSTGVYDITSENITQIKITFTETETYIRYCILDFQSDNYIHNPTIKDIE